MNFALFVLTLQYFALAESTRLSSKTDLFALDETQNSYDCTARPMMYSSKSIGNATIRGDICGVRLSSIGHPKTKLHLLTGFKSEMRYMENGATMGVTFKSNFNHRNLCHSPPVRSSANITNSGTKMYGHGDLYVIHTVTDISVTIRGPTCAITSDRRKLLNCLIAIIIKGRG
jgi:hypothetical protein